jgi:hypothetical protein
MKPEFSQHIFEKSSDIIFHENQSIGIRVVPYGQTDMTKLIITFRNFANAPKNGFGIHPSFLPWHFRHDFDGGAQISELAFDR